MKAYLGEFVSGRLLNVYESLLNGELVRKAEVESKKRVLAEEILEIESLYGEFAQDLVIPLEYFLFNKLHKRAIIYPPALYSYIKTYTCPSSDENKAFTLEGFAEAALSLQSSGILRFESRGGAPHIRISGEGLKSRAFASILSLFNLTTRGVRQYAVHGYAGRVGFNVFKDEALSKVKRMQEKVDPPEELEEPKRLIGLEEGVMLPKTEQMVQRLATLSGMVAYTKREKSLGEIYTTARLLTLTAADGREARFVLKHFADIRSVKWAILNVWSRSRASSAPRRRRGCTGSTSASIALRSRGVSTPMIMGAVLDDKVLVKEYIEGERLSDIVQERPDREVGGDRDGRTVRGGDGCSPQGGLLPRRLEGDQRDSAGRREALLHGPRAGRAEGGDQAWDVAAFVYYQAKLSLKEAGTKKVDGSVPEGLQGCERRGEHREGEEPEVRRAVQALDDPTDAEGGQGVDRGLLGLAVGSSSSA